jgi:hypothetical protein
MVANGGKAFIYQYATILAGKIKAKGLRGLPSNGGIPPLILRYLQNGAAYENPFSALQSSGLPGVNGGTH